MPHTVPHQLAHVNFAPKEVGRAVDLWHVDNVAIDYVLFATSTLDVEGGAFEVWRGTKTEFAELHTQNLTVPRQRVDSLKAPAGYAVLLQGKHVVHRAAPLDAPAERITFVNSYVPTKPHAEASSVKILRAVDDAHVVATEWSVHRALRARAQLDSFLEQASYSHTTEFYMERLSAIRDDLVDAIAQLQDVANDGKEEHFGGAYNDEAEAPKSEL